MCEGRTRRDWAVFLLTLSILPHLCQGATGTGFLDKVGLQVKTSHSLITQDLEKTDAVLNINTCYECTHGLTREETFQLHDCTANSTVSRIYISDMFSDLKVRCAND